MTTETAMVEVSRHVTASPEQVFDAWLDPESVGRWLFATPAGRMERVEVDPRVGGSFRIEERRGDELAAHWGTFVEIDRPRRLVFDFATSFGETPTRIAVSIEPDGDGSRITLRHEGVWAGWEDRTRQGWTMILDGLDRTLD
ncbi:MAG: SRPBCC family protein [Allosphingosinicella sp.]